MPEAAAVLLAALRFIDVVGFRPTVLGGVIGGASPGVSLRVI
jgi:hypothetical protein